MVKTLWLGAVAAMIGVASIAIGAEKEPPAWKKPAPGTRAFLGDDGGGVNTATVCDTADRYRDWLRYEHPRGCQTFQHDLPVVIEVVTLDPAIDNVRGVYTPIAKVRIPSRNFAGYVSLLGLHPIIPSGVIVHYKKLGNDSLLLFPTAEISSNDSGGIDLGEQASAKVISYDPTKDDKWDLHVQIIDGPHAGESGWMLAFGAVGDDGVPIEQFDRAVISN
jgi:hypothetical protein